MQQLKTLNQSQLQTLKQQVASLKLLNNLQNPESMLQMAAGSNPLIAKALELGRGNGGDYDSITASILQQNGYDAQAVQRQLREAGII